MAVGDYDFPNLSEVPGIRVSATAAGIKYRDRDDMVLVEIAEGGSVAGVFTKNRFCAAPVTLCKEHLASGQGIRYLVINSGNANACTGEQGMADAVSTCEQVAESSGVSAKQVLPFSTGVIGEPLPFERLASAVPALVDGLSADSWPQIAKAIMTTDTRPKGASVELQWQGETIVINGIAKGAGMIKPNMATMLAYVATNAAIAQPLLDRWVKQLADASFNRITIDGDTSTNDSCILMASGKTPLPAIEDETSDFAKALYASLLEVFQKLAKSIVADGEGATKFVTIDVESASSSDEALKVAYAVAHSPLVKTALFASDPNWGRIVAAIGYAGIDDLDQHQVDVYIGDVQIVANGGRHPEYTEEAGQAVFDQSSIVIRILLNRGKVTETLWTTDLSHEYVTINAEYRT